MNPKTFRAIYCSLGPNDEAERLLFFYLKSGKGRFLNTYVPMSIHNPTDPSDTIV